MEIKCHKFKGIYQTGNNIATINLVPGIVVYGEKIIKKGEKEYRIWDPTRSKACAAILKGIKKFPVKQGSKILYLGASTGTTCSHLSDVIGHNGIIYAVEFAERVFRELMHLSEKRKNIVPIFADAHRVNEYYWVEEVDVVYCDLAQPDEIEIAIKNAKEFLKRNGYLMVAIKSQSIDVTKKPREVYRIEVAKLKKNGFKIIDKKELEPFEKDHCFVLAKLI